MLEYIPIPAIIIGSLLYAWWKKAYLTQVMVISNFFIFLYVFLLIQMDNTAGDGMIEAFTFVPARIADPLYLPTIITSMYMHLSPIHLISNILILYLIGLPLEERIGSGKWGIIYIASGIAGTLLYFLFNLGSEVHLLGASGAIFGLGGALLILYSKDEIPMFLGPIFSSRAPVWAAVGIMFVWETVLVFLQVDDGTAHVAHIGGIVCGIFLAPAIVKKTIKAREINLDFPLLKQMALKPEDLLMVEKIENETELDVKKAWLEFYLKEAARCPKCRRHLGEGYEKSGKSPATPGAKIDCACGLSYNIWK
jgi:membrane associated rhomboid family serine protease